MRRYLQPELLDSLAPDDPAALHNRRDLRLTNHLMGNWRWLARTLPRVLRPGERALELGAGTGELARRFHARGLAVDGLDLWPRPPDWPSAAAWHQADLTHFDAWARYPVILGNLIFHQFSSAQLAALGATLAPHARVILACEPARYRVFQLGFALACRVFGANHVSRHDGHVSIAAGFRGDELARALGLDPHHWHWQARTTPFGACRFLAERRAALQPPMDPHSHR